MATAQATASTTLGELDERAVARGLHHPPAVRGDLRVDELAPVRLQARERADLVRAHEPAVAHDVGGKDRGKPTLDGGALHRSSGAGDVD
jgi:hypothetical protein